MIQNNLKYTVIIFVLFTILFTSSFNQNVSAIETLQIPKIFADATKHFMKGEYAQSIILYDEILEVKPNDAKTLLMKGTALSNLDRHKKSILEFKKVLINDPDNLMALLGMGVGFGNFGEYKQAHKYFFEANQLSPDNHIIINYKEFAEKVITKYPYNEVELPEIFEMPKIEIIPSWVKNNAGWWAEDKIGDVEFISALQFLIKNGIIKIETVEMNENNSSIIPTWVKNNAGWWAGNEITDHDFLSGIYYMIENAIIIIDSPEKKEITKEEQAVLDRNLWEFERYLYKIEKTVSDDTRYIEFPNPSNDVIKKFLRDYKKWNFEQQLQIGNESFPTPMYTLIDDVYHVNYKIYVNPQPNGLPLDHVGTLNDSFVYWEEQTMLATDGKNVKINFEIITSKINANLWITWVVRDLGENVLGHANIGKGVVEVALGGSGCDGNFQLFHVDTVKDIMTHEIGHGVGLLHSDNNNDIMYPKLKNVQYAYCLLDVNKQFTNEVSGIILK